MANTIEFIIKATDKASEVVASIESKITTGTKNAAESLDNLSKTSDKFSGGFSKMQAGIVAANQAFDLVGRGIGIVKDVIDQTVGSTVAYAKEVRDLSTNLGITAEETSKIIQASDDYGISVETVTSALQMAVKNGFAPNLETLAKLADEYNSIASPTERAARLTDVFGRGWTSLTPMLKAGGTAIRGAADEAKKLGLVLSDKDVQGARALEVQIDNLNDRIEAIKLRIGKGLIPELVKAAEDVVFFIDKVSGTVTPLQEAQRNYDRVLAAFGETSEVTAAARAELQRLLDEEKKHVSVTKTWEDVLTKTSDAMGGLKKEVTLAVPSFDELAQAEKHAATEAKLLDEKFAGLKVAIGGALKTEMESYGEKQTDLGEKAAKLRDEIEKLESSHGRAITTAQKATMTDAERASAIAKLAVLQEDYTGAVKKENETELEFQSRMADTAVKIEDVQGKLGEASGAVTGYINNSKKIAELKGQYDDINKEIESNAKAHEDATRRIIFGYAEQQLAIDGFTETEFQALDKLSVQLGLKSEEDVAAFEAIRKATSDLAADGSIEDFVEQVGAAAGVDLTPIKDDVEELKTTAKGLAEEPITIPIKVDKETAKRSLDETKAELRDEAKFGEVEIPVKAIPIGVANAPQDKALEFLTGGLSKQAEDASKAMDITGKAAEKAIGAVGDVASKTTDKAKAVADTTESRYITMANTIVTKFGSVASSVIGAFDDAANTAIPTIVSIADEIDKLPTFKEFIYKITVVGSFPEAPGFQHGVDMIVPPNPRGGAGDYFPFVAAPGERVIVQTPAQQQNSIIAPRNGDTVTYITNVYNPLAAAMLADKQRRDRIARSNARMGVV